jgi:hypothetical protein
LKQDFVKFFFFLKQDYFNQIVAAKRSRICDHVMLFMERQNEKVWEGIEQQNYVSVKLAQISYAITESTK